MVFGYSATRRTSFRSWFLACQRVLPQACPLQHPWHLQGSKLIDHSKSYSSLSTSSPTTSSTVSSESVDRQERGDPWGIDHHPVIVSSERVERQERRDVCSSGTSEELLTKPPKNPKPNKNEDPRFRTRVRTVSFRQTRMAARIERKSCGWQSSWKQRLTRKFFSWIIFRACENAALGKHSGYTHFPKDRNCEICQRTKMTRAPCRRRIGGAVPRAVKFWWFDFSISQSSQRKTTRRMGQSPLNLMIIKFRESGQPVFRATSPLSRGTLKSKGSGKLSIHFCADGDTIETVSRTINYFC